MGDICRSSGASIALRPVLRDAGDSFVLEISGTTLAVEAADASLEKLLAQGDGVLTNEEDIGDVSERESERSEDVQVPAYRRVFGDDLQEKEFEMPRWTSDVVIGMRTPGGKSIGKPQGLLALQKITRVMELEAVQTNDKEKTHLRAVGEPAALDYLTELLDERQAACEDMMSEQFEVPTFALGMLFRGDRPLSAEVEVKSGTLLSIRGPKDKERQTAQIQIRGTYEKIEHVKGLIMRRIKGRGGRGGNGKAKGSWPDQRKDKGKGKGRERGIRESKGKGPDSHI